jgi:hypothetical protein
MFRPYIPNKQPIRPNNLHLTHPAIMATTPDARARLTTAADHLDRAGVPDRIGRAARARLPPRPARRRRWREGDRRHQGDHDPRAGNVHETERALRAANARMPIIRIPFDLDLRALIDSGNYSPELVERRSTRLPIKQLAVEVCRRLV